MDKLTNLPCGIGESLREVSLPSIGQRGLKGPLELIAVQFMSSSDLIAGAQFSFRNDGE
jgi:hypothetical protein